MVGAEPRIQIAQMEKAVDQQPSANEQDEGDGDFANHQQGANTMATTASTGVSTSFFQGVVEIEIGCLSRWSETKKHSCH